MIFLSGPKDCRGSATRCIWKYIVPLLSWTNQELWSRDHVKSKYSAMTSSNHSSLSIKTVPGVKLKDDCIVPARSLKHPAYAKRINREVLVSDDQRSANGPGCWLQSGAESILCQRKQTEPRLLTRTCPSIRVHTVQFSCFVQISLLWGSPAHLKLTSTWSEAHRLRFNLSVCLYKVECSLELDTLDFVFVFVSHLRPFCFCLRWFYLHTCSLAYIFHCVLMFTAISYQSSATWLCLNSLQLLNQAVKHAIISTELSDYRMCLYKP